MGRREGFPGQRMRVVPTPVLREAAGDPLTAPLVVTDCGYFPRAAGHLRRRTRGIEECIVMVCAEGRGYLALGGERLPVEAGHVALIPPGTPHEYGADDEAPWTLWWLHVRGPCAAAFAARIAEATGQPVFALRSPGRAIALVDAALRHLEHGDAPADLRAAAGAAWHLLGSLPREHQRSAGRADPVHLARELLVERLPQRTSVAELARLVGLSPSYLSTLFKQALGYGILEYQTRQRLASACELLATTDLAIATVARRVGYDDPYYFSRQFHQVHGVSPREYRRTLQHVT